MGAGLRFFMGMHNKLYRMTGGKAFNMDGTLLLLSTTGSKTGKQRTNPLVHLKLEDGGRVIAASAGGADRHPAWFFNIKKNPEVQFEFEGETFGARARVAEEPERSELYAKLEAMQPRFSDYKAKTERVIPVVVLEPQ